MFPSYEINCSCVPYFEDADEIWHVESLQFNFETINFATNSFSDVNRLGEGGFGFVYKVCTTSIVLV